MVQIQQDNAHEALSVAVGQGHREFPFWKSKFPKIPVMKIPPYTPCVSVSLSKSSFIYQLLINPSSRAFDSDHIRSFDFRNPAVDRKSDRKSRVNGGDVSLK